MDFVQLISQPPWSAIVVLLVTMGMSTFTALITRKVTNQAKLQRYRKEISEWRKMMAEARKTKDEKLTLEVNRRAKIIQRMNTEVSKQSFKPVAVFFIPFMLIWWILSSIFGARIVALIPYNLGLIPFIGSMAGTSLNGGSVFGLSFFGWYIFCSFSFGMMINRILGVRLT
nr:EMC3/TMCO1 family protein [Candidatus Njordarchaeum guaymaensis]